MEISRIHLSNPKESYHYIYYLLQIVSSFFGKKGEVSE